jgi:hypothetical protein
MKLIKRLLVRLGCLPVLDMDRDFVMKVDRDCVAYCNAELAERGEEAACISYKVDHEKQILRSFKCVRTRDGAILARAETLDEVADVVGIP